MGRPGYTLVELLVVLGIMAGLLAASVPRLAVLQREQQLDNAAQTIEQAVNSASALASAPSQFTDADKSQVNGGIQDTTLSYAGHHYVGTVLLLGPSSTSTPTEWDTISIREWQEPADPGKSSQQPQSLSDDSGYFPEVKSFHLPSTIYIQTPRNVRTQALLPSGYFRTVAGNTSAFPAKDESITDPAVSNQLVPPIATVAFASAQSGRPSLALFEPPTYRQASTDTGTAILNDGYNPFLRLIVKRSNYSGSCREVTIWLSRPGVSTRNLSGGNCV